jgi:hypothetical protein
LDAYYVSDNTGDLSSLFDGSITNEGSAATITFALACPVRQHYPFLLKLYLPMHLFQ